jgi:hypothetical protein
MDDTEDDQVFIDNVNYLIQNSMPNTIDHSNRVAVQQFVLQYLYTSRDARTTAVLNNLLQHANLHTRIDPTDSMAIIRTQLVDYIYGRDLPEQNSLVRRFSLINTGAGHQGTMPQPQPQPRRRPVQRIPNFLIDPQLLADGAAPPSTYLRNAPLVIGILPPQQSNGMNHTGRLTYPPTNGTPTSAHNAPTRNPRPTNAAPTSTPDARTPDPRSAPGNSSTRTRRAPNSIVPADLELRNLIQDSDGYGLQCDMCSHVRKQVREFSRHVKQGAGGARPSFTVIACNPNQYMTWYGRDDNGVEYSGNIVEAAKGIHSVPMPCAAHLSRR